MSIDKKALYPLYTLTVVVWLLMVVCFGRAFLSYDILYDKYSSLVRWGQIYFVGGVICTVFSVTVARLLSDINTQAHELNMRINAIEKSIESKK